MSYLSLANTMYIIKLDRPLKTGFNFLFSICHTQEANVA